jgi:5'(3')-deoxyribonucleotidase
MLDWLDRVIFTEDKSLLQGDILIDDDPFPMRTDKEGIQAYEYVLVVWD